MITDIIKTENKPFKKKPITTKTIKATQKVEPKTINKNQEKLKNIMLEYFKLNIDAFRAYNNRGNSITLKASNGKHYTLFYKTTVKK